VLLPEGHGVQDKYLKPSLKYSDLAARKNGMHGSRFGDGDYPKNVTFKRLFLQLILQDIMHVSTQLLTK